jgi:hypothetical protein
MTISKKMIAAALFVALAAGGAEAARKNGGGGGGGGVSTNYGCSTLKAGRVVYTLDGRTKSLLTATWACYLCNMTTGQCAIQSPSTLVGWYFNLPL